MASGVADWWLAPNHVGEWNNGARSGRELQRILFYWCPASKITKVTFRENRLRWVLVSLEHRIDINDYYVELEGGTVPP